MVASEAICDAGKEMIAYLEMEGGHQADIDSIVAISVKACDWAKELRDYTDKLAAYYRQTSHHENDPWSGAWILEFRSWRDQGTTLIRMMSEAQIANAKPGAAT
jgi:hypothetical protein